MCISWHHLMRNSISGVLRAFSLTPLLSAKARSLGCFPFLLPRVFFTWFSFLWICLVLLHRNLSRWFLQFCLSFSYSRVIFLASPTTHVQTETYHPFIELSLELHLIGNHLSFLYPRPPGPPRVVPTTSFPVPSSVLAAVTYFPGRFDSAGLSPSLSPLH